MARTFDLVGGAGSLREPTSPAPTSEEMLATFEELERIISAPDGLESAGQQRIAGLLVPRYAETCALDLQGEARAASAEVGAQAAPAPEALQLLELPLIGAEGTFGRFVFGWSRRAPSAGEVAVVRQIAGYVARAVECVQLRNKCTRLVERQELAAAPLRGVAGPEDRSSEVTLVTLARITSERQRRAAGRLSLLADTGKLLEESLEVKPTLMALARLAVRHFAHACVVRVVDEDSVLGDVVIGRDPGTEAAVRRVVDRYVEVMPHVLRPSRELRTTRRSLVELGEAAHARLVAPVDERVLNDLALDGDHLESLRRVGLRSFIVVPLVARSTRIGLLSLWRVQGPNFDAEDLALTEEFARRAALAVDNARLFRRANAALAARDEFLSVASHELNTPLTPLKLSIDGLRTLELPAELRNERIAAAARCVERLSRLVSELVDTAQLSNGPVPLQKERVDLTPLLEDVLSRMSADAQRAGCALRAVLARSCVGSWDRSRIEQVAANLIDNAIKFGANQPIEVRLSAEGSRARLEVHDQGTGIPSEERRRIFDRFERAVSSRNYGGLGVGLWISRQIVEASGGTISVKNGSSGGTTFVVDLPRE